MNLDLKNTAEVKEIRSQILKASGKERTEKIETFNTVLRKILANNVTILIGGVISVRSSIWVVVSYQ